MSIEINKLARVSPTEVMRLNVSIADISNNGYDNFSCTISTFSSREKRPNEAKVVFEGRVYYENGSGISEQNMRQYFPEFLPVYKVNNCDIFGLPCYPLVDVNHHTKEHNAFRLSKSDRLLASKLKYSALVEFLLEQMDKQYKGEVKEAIGILEKESGKTYVQKDNVSPYLYNDINYTLITINNGWNIYKGMTPKPISYPVVK